MKMSLRWLGLGIAALVSVSCAHQQGAPEARASCVNDFDCTNGQRCIKPYLSTGGVCSTVVNAYGSPVYAPPRPDSIGPGRRQCVVSSDCPLMFRCDSGICVK
jgi:hypothetical protein